MINTLILLWLASAVPILFEQRVLKMIIYLGIFSIITSIIFFIFGAPDVALAEASVSIFATIFLVICFEKYYSIKEQAAGLKWRGFVLPGIFTLGLFVLFVNFVPEGAASTYAMVQFINYFGREVGGQNAVTSIYLGYRLYDTVFESLMLLVTVVAISHMSWHGDRTAHHEKRVAVSKQATRVIRIISPLLPMFGIYLISSGHLFAGGGFQGGIVLAAFFVCRYMTHTIYDLPVEALRIGEKLVFFSIMLVSIVVVFLGLPGAFRYEELFQNFYLITMNTLIGAKVALGFTMLFYRFIVIERH